MKSLILSILLLFEIIKKCSTYNESIPFNWTKTPNYCYVEDFYLSPHYRTLIPDIYPIRGCSSNERNKKYTSIIGITNITFHPRLDFFFPNELYPQIDTDPPTYMTFRLNFLCSIYKSLLTKNNTYHLYIHFGRNEDYHNIPKISKRTGKPIEFIGNKALLSAKFKFYVSEIEKKMQRNITGKDFYFFDYEGEELNVTFDGYELDFHFNEVILEYAERILLDKNFCPTIYYNYILLIRVYDLPRMKVQGQFQYRSSIIRTSDNKELKTNVYTIDTRNIFFQNISMFYNQRVNVTNEGDEPTGEDSGFWINTPCNQPQMATIMVDYYFFEIIHKMKRFGYEFNDRFQLRIHTPYYRKTLTSNYSLFRSQWNESFEKPRVFIHPIYKYKEYCQKYKNCTKFNYEEWSTDPKWTKFIIDIKNEIVNNEIRINFTELEKIYEADGFNRSKLVINVNNTMTPHITQITNGLWAELIDLETNDWVMKTKTIMDEIHGYLDNNEADPFRNFYLTCEIPDNITKDDIEFIVKKYGILQTAHLWFRLDVFNKGITKMFPPRFNIVFRFPPEIVVTNNTFGYTYQYYRIPGSLSENWYHVLKDFRKDGLKDGSLTNTTFDFKRNIINVSEIHQNIPNGEDTLFYTQVYEYLCKSSNISDCLLLEIKRQFLYYFYDLSITFTKNVTRPIDITVFQIKYVPYHSKDQINRGLHRWNPYHAGWKVAGPGIYIDDKNGMEYYAYYSEPYLDNYYYKPIGANEYSNLRGSTDVRPYSGPNCVFGIAGGSSLRNKSCEFWNGLIPDQPFTNYARDIYEEHIAYRTLNNDSFAIDVKTEVRAEYLSFAVLDPFAGKFTGITFESLYWINVENYYNDGEPACKDFYEKPKVCGGNYECLKPTYNIHEYPKEFFVKIKLPEGFSVNATCIGKVLPCYWASKASSRFTTYSLQDYLCFYINSTHIYAFNSIGQLGFCPNSGYYDIIIQIDGIYIHENTNIIKKGSGFIQFGFYETNFFVSEYPRNLEDDPMYYNKNVSIKIARSNMTNDGIGNFTFNVTATDWFNKDNVFRIDFSPLIKNAALTKLAYNGYIDDEKIINLKNVDGFNYNNIRYDYYWPFLNLPSGKDVGPSFIISPYADYHYEHTFPWNVSFIKQNETMIFEINLTLENYRSFKPINLEYYMTNLSYSIVFDYEIFHFENNIPQYLMNLTIVPNSLFINDRAVYIINYITYMKEILEGDIFEFKTSWKSLYKTKKVPDEEGYYINRVIFDKNISLNDTNMTIYIDPIINPDTFEVEYIKDIKILDKEEYLIAVYEGIIPIQMKKYIGFKHSEVDTIRTEKDKTKFDIYFEIIPEVLIQKNDSLIIKFSEGVLLQNYLKCYIEAEKGLNILDKDFICEINKEENEIIFYNGFKYIGETEFIFDDKNSTALIDQEIKFVLKDIKINRTDEDDEIFSLEIKIERNGIITQKNNLASIAHFECGYRCKTCEKENNNLCLSCIEEYPFYYKKNKECHKKCPTEHYYITFDEEGNKECDLCNEYCETCEGREDYCSRCIKSFFLENNTCVKNCSEGKISDYLLRKCYPIINIKEPEIVEKKVYINISIPEPYPIYIEKNICPFKDEIEKEEEYHEEKNEEEEKISKNEEEDKIFNHNKYNEEEIEAIKIKEENISKNEEEDKIYNHNEYIEEEIKVKKVEEENISKNEEEDKIYNHNEYNEEEIKVNKIKEEKISKIEEEDKVYNYNEYNEEELNVKEEEKELVTILEISKEELNKEAISKEEERIEYEINLIEEEIIKQTNNIDLLNKEKKEEEEEDTNSLEELNLSYIFENKKEKINSEEINREKIEINNDLNEKINQDFEMEKNENNMDKEEENEKALFEEELENNKKEEIKTEEEEVIDKNEKNNEKSFNKQNIEEEIISTNQEEKINNEKDEIIEEIKEENNVEKERIIGKQNEKEEETKNKEDYDKINEEENNEIKEKKINNKNEEEKEYEEETKVNIQENNLNDNSENEENIEEEENNILIKEQNFKIFTDILIHKFKYKKPAFDYYLLPVIVLLSLLVCEICFWTTSINLLFYILDYLIIGIGFKIDLILVFAFSFRTGHEPFFFPAAIIFIIHIYITTTFAIFNNFGNKLNNNLKNNNKLTWILSLIACIFVDYRCFELFTRTKIIFNKICKSNKEKIILQNKKINEEKSIVSNSFYKNNNNSTYQNIINTEDKYLNINKNIKNEIYNEYILEQEICINKFIIILDLILVDLFFTFLCVFIAIKYKTYSFLWFASIYGIVFSFLNILFSIRFTFIQSLKVSSKEKFVDIKNNKIKNKVNSEEDLKKNKTKIIEDSYDEEEQSYNSNNIYNKRSKYMKEDNELNNSDSIHNNFRLTNDKLSQNETQIVQNSSLEDEINYEEIIKNPLRDDIMLNREKHIEDLDETQNKGKVKIIRNKLRRNDEINPKTVEKNDDNIKEIDGFFSKIKNCRNENDEGGILSSFRSSESDELKISSTESINPINTIKNKDLGEMNGHLKLNEKSNIINNFNDFYSHNNSEEIKKQEKEDSKDDYDEDDNYSVIQNPIRDDMIN